MVVFERDHVLCWGIHVGFQGCIDPSLVPIIRQRGLAKVDAEDSHPFPREVPIIIKMHMFIIHYLTAYFFLFNQSKLVSE